MAFDKAYEALGWAFAECVELQKQGVDLATIDCAAMVERMQVDLELQPINGEPQIPMPESVHHAQAMSLVATKYLRDNGAVPDKIAVSVEPVAFAISDTEEKVRPLSAFYVQEKLADKHIEGYEPEAKLHKVALITHPPAKVPDYWLIHQNTGLITVTHNRDEADYAKSLGQFVDAVTVITTPTPATTPEAEWKPAHGMSDDLPLIGEPVMGFHRDWIDEDFCKDGIRECFLFGDGSEWQSARWDGYSDQWIVEDGAPELWHSHPTPPTAQEGE